MAKGRNFQKILVSQTVQGGMSSEEKQEEIKRWNQNNKLLGIIAENTAGGGGADPRVTPDTEAGGPSIGVLGAMLAGALGTMVGMIQGHIKAIKFFGEKLLPNKLITGIGDKMAAMKNFFGKGMDRIVGFFRRFSEMFGKAGGGTFTKIMDAMKSGVAAIKNFFKPITDALQMVKSGGGPITKMINGIKGAFAGFMNFFKGLGSTMGAFSGIFSAVAKVVGKIFFPLTVIMTLWDSVKGAFAGFEEDGIVGALTGAVKGFVNSLIMAPLDMLKSAVSWIAGAFGFDQAEAYLDSFSFEDMFSGLMDGLTDAILAIPEYIGKMVDWIGEKISEAMTFVGDVFNMYIIEPLGNLVQEYVIDPISAAFEPLANWFKDIKETVTNFLETFGIPAITLYEGNSFIDPIVIGPWYPFRPEAGTETIAASTNISSETTESNGQVITDSESFNDQIANVESDRGTVLVTTSQTDNLAGTSRVGEGLVTFDTESGQARVNMTGMDGQDIDSNISTSAYREIKLGAKRGEMDAQRLQEIVEEDIAYNDDRLTWLDRRKVDVGYASATELLAQRMDEQSVDNSVARSAPASGGGNTNVVNAPTTNSSTTAVTYKPNIRNPQPTVAMADVY